MKTEFSNEWVVQNHSHVKPIVVKMGWVEVAVGIVTNPFEPLMIGMAKFSPQIQNKFFYEKEAG